MASTIQGYEYDVFISYRHNDNLDGWVSEFVRDLEKELKGAIKAPVSIYFDTNPQDGLLEIYNVDKSLEGKLRSLILIPIISQTYCDPKSYAWQHEFCLFKKLAAEDDLGLEVALLNGNVAGRILPVQIHDLDEQDKRLLETELAGALRPIEFIYRASGVNRSLKPKDERSENLNHTQYPDQINKVANAIKEIILGIKRTRDADLGIPVRSPLPEKLGSVLFYNKLKSRNVIGASLVYVLTALILWKIMSICSNLLDLNGNFVRITSIILVAQFPIAVLLSWLYERSPQGFIRTTSPASLINPFRKEQKKPLTGKRFITFLIASLVALLIIPQLEYVNPAKNHVRMEKSIAVLPFVNDSHDEDNTYFINGIMEEILNNLQKIKDFRVLSRASTERFRSASYAIPDIAKRLDVNYIVVGSGQKYGNNFRLRVRLIDTRNEAQLLSKTYAQEIKGTTDIFNIQSKVAQDIADELEASITPVARQSIEKKATSSLTAYDFYQRARDEHSRFLSDNSDTAALEKAESLFKTAIRYDSSFAQAYTGLAMVYRDKHYWDEYLSRHFLDSILYLADRALLYNDRLDEAYILRAAYFMENGKLEQSVEENNKAIDCNPNCLEAYLNNGLLYAKTDIVKSIENYLYALKINRGERTPDILRSLASDFGNAGFREKADSYIREALRLDNDSLMALQAYAWRESCEGNHSQAIDLFKKCYQRDSDNVYVSLGLGLNCDFSGRYKESFKYFSRYAERLKSPERFKIFTIISMHRIGYSYFMNGHKKEADQWFREQIKYCEESIKLNRTYNLDYSAYYDLAGIYAFLGNREKAYENLRLFNKIKSCDVVWLMNMSDDPLFDSIRKEPEFRKIKSDIEAKYQAEHKSVAGWIEEHENM
jgi:TolB-like protein/Tfp pilus assembly protein PilF